MLMFDASNRDQCEVKRPTTNTPLQALVLLNDPQVLEGARVLAERLSLERSGTNEKIEKAFRLIICREPGDKEKELLQSYYAKEKERFSKERSAAEDFINVGEYKHENVSDVGATAALMQVIHTIYNMEEAITKS